MCNCTIRDLLSCSPSEFFVPVSMTGIIILFIILGVMCCRAMKS